MLRCPMKSDTQIDAFACDEIQLHSNSKNAYFLSHSGNSGTKNFAHVLRIVTPIRTKSFE